MSFVTDVALKLGVTPGYLLRLARSAPHRYKVYSIPKKDGSSSRQIAQPAKELKAVQRALATIFGDHLPVHEAATAYQKGSKILRNAEAHAESRFLLKLDFENFFPSIRPGDLTAHLSAYWPLTISPQDIEFISRIIFWAPPKSGDLRLSIGAPSSPFVANTILYDFDVSVSDISDEFDAVYTRYADDVAISSNRPGATAKMHEEVRRIVRKMDYPQLRVNDKKTLYTSKKYRRRVTGLIIANSGKVSLGRDRKRLISAMVHRFKVGTLEKSRISRLRGLLSFAKDVEPQFLDRLASKYGSDVLEALGVRFKTD
jgi:hypothetical protein